MRRHRSDDASTDMALFGRSVRARHKRSLNPANDVITTSWSSYDRLSVDLNGVWDSAVAEYVPSWSHDDDVIERTDKASRNTSRRKRIDEQGFSGKQSQMLLTSLPRGEQIQETNKRPKRSKSRHRKNKRFTLTFFNFAENKPLHASATAADEKISRPVHAATFEDDQKSSPVSDSDVIDVSNYLDTLALDSNAVKPASDVPQHSRSLPSFRFNMAPHRKPVKAATRSEACLGFDGENKYRPALSPINEALADDVTLRSGRAQRLAVPTWYPPEQSDWSNDAYDKWWEI